MSRDLIAEFARPVPRYTSYPTAPHFRNDIGPGHYRRWLSQLAPGERLSLYVDIPFCSTLCWFCACSTKMVRRYDPVADYCASLLAEAEHVARSLPRGCSVAHLHFGGGSPDVLAPGDFRRLADRLRELFAFGPGAEIAMEVDPRNLDAEKIAAFAAAGLTRISLGAQDFDSAVQAAINRRQTREQTRAAVDHFRAAGVGSINIDLVYGLPRQTLTTAERTVEAVLALDPDRIAMFGYAHLPERVRRQRMIPAEALPGAHERFALARLMSRRLVEAGYVRIGMDHFCKPDDPMATGEIHRNFQGYTTDTADTLLGLGASAIGRLRQGYVQNALPVAQYRRCVESGDFATVRGIALSAEDRARAFAIERLMCDLRFPAGELKRRFGEAGKAVAAEGERIASADSRGLVLATPDGFAVSEEGRPFIRTICSWFDAYFAPANATHSTGI